MPRLDRLQRAALLATAFLYSAGYASIGLVLVLLTVIGEGVVTRTLPWRRSPADGLLVGFVAVFVASGWLSSFRPMAVGSAGLAALTIYLAFGALYRQLHKEPAFLRPLLATWAAGAAGAAIWALILNRTTGAPAFTPALGQNAVGTTMLIGTMLGLGVLGSTGRMRYLGAVAVVLSAAALVFSYTRGAWVGAASGLGLLVLTAGRKPALGAAVLTLLIVLGGLIAPPPERQALIQRAAAIPSLTINQDRIFLYRAAWRMFVDHPLLGTGLNTFSRLYPSYRLAGDTNPPAHPFAHNMYLNMAAEGGILGATAFGAIVALGLLAGWRRLRRQVDPGDRALVAALLAAYVGMLVHQIFDGTLFSVHLGAGLWMALAMLLAP